MSARRGIGALLAALVGVYALAPARVAAQCPASGDCREVHANPGCVMPECCEIVCDIDPACCDITWSQSCVDIALQECDGINCPAAGSCEVVHGSPGCADYDCCEFIVAVDPWCTFGAWDEWCAAAAERFCDVPRCTVDTKGIPDEAEPCYLRLNDGWAAAAEWPRIDLACGASLKGRVVDGGPRDLEWFALDGPARRRVAVTLEAEFPIELQYMLGGAEGPNEVRWLSAPGLCAGEVRLVFLTTAGTGTLILGAGDANRAWRDGIDCDEIDPKNPPDPADPPPVQVVGTRWRLRIDCLGIADINGDGAVDSADLGALLSAWGPIDPGQPIDVLAADADLDGDGEVGSADLGILLSNW